MSIRTPEDRQADKDFEDEVLRIARLIYPGTSGGAEMVGGRERDGVLVGRDVAIAIEATRSRAALKAEGDAKKLRDLVSSLARQNPTRLVRGFFITSDEPTADQRLRVKKHGGDLVSAISFNQFRRQLFDAQKYLSARVDYAFGSARDLRTNGVKVSGPYIPMDLMQLPGLSESWTLDALVENVSAGAKVVLTGEYGVGKSMTLREVHLRLAEAYRRDPARPIPIHLNLRDHRGQEDPAEALHRHARLIGFGHPEELVRAWRSEQLVLILDGFDEITYPGWTGKVGSLADVRRSNVALIRRIISDTPSSTGVLVAGRGHFFDSTSELSSALGLPPQYAHLSASDFSQEQVERFLGDNGLAVRVPAWLPSRPLLLGYLALNGFLGGDLASDQGGPAEGWDMLLQRVAEREAEMEVRVDGYLVRRILERAATRARRSSSGRGPLRFDELTAAFREVCGYEPDEGSRVILDRLPGLGVGRSYGDSGRDLPREFIDSDFADAARAGDVYLFAVGPQAAGLNSEDVRQWQTLLGDVGMDVAWHRMSRDGLNGHSIAAALESSESRWPDSGLSADLLRILSRQGGAIRGRAPVLTNHVFPSFVITANAALGGTQIKESIVERLEIEGLPEDPSRMPQFSNTSFEEIYGVSSPSELPAAKFENCTLGEFIEGAENTSEILGLGITDESKVVLVILKKLYRQRGSGRKDSALRRGGLTGRQRELVEPVLALLLREGLVVKAKAGGTTVWVPVATSRRRALQILSAPTTSHDPVLQWRGRE